MWDKRQSCPVPQHDAIKMYCAVEVILRLLITEIYINERQFHALSFPVPKKSLRYLVDPKIEEATLVKRKIFGERTSVKLFFAD
jgi:hypothetical protein